jgi:hypothetical protein
VTKASLISIAVATLFAGSTQAQTCSPTAGVIVAGTMHINTCSSSNQLLMACDGVSPIGASPDTIYSLQLNGSESGSLSAMPTGYDLKLALLQGTCSGESTCIRDADSGGPGASETFGLSGLPAGSYYVLLTSSGGTPDCGETRIEAFNVPVTLQKFSVD